MVHFLALSMLFGFLAAYLGSFLSYSAPKMPTGPWIVMALSLITFISVIFAPEKGILARRRVKKKNRRKIIQENILKAFYQMDEKLGGAKGRTVEALSDYLGYDKTKSLKGIKALRKKGLTFVLDREWALTSEGEVESRRIVRLHRLWELYLTKRMLINPDLVHSDAEAIEHVITPALEYQLTQELGDPLEDPHDSIIPSIRK